LGGGVATHRTRGRSKNLPIPKEVKYLLSVAQLRPLAHPLQ
jgi:hypothetical protein